MRVGHGLDTHRFGAGSHVVLGGVRIPHSHGLIAHSDGDVVIHALCDALLGAAGQGDIGRHFPDSHAEFRGVDSRVLLGRVMVLLKQLGLAVVNVDVTVVAQAPRLAPHVPQMVENLATDLQVGPDRINIKATTTEGLGFTGRGEGIAAHAVVLLESP